jgi:hypothetical protein
VAVKEVVALKAAEGDLAEVVDVVGAAAVLDVVAVRILLRPLLRILLRTRLRILVQMRLQIR